MIWMHSYRNLQLLRSWTFWDWLVFYSN